MSIAIKVTDLSKKYKLYQAPIDRLKESLHPLKKKYHQEFLANKDISFEIKRGEVVGIIGRNGSGKSTLLKMITGVLTPSSGDVEVNGKITAMLELGSGFNPELSGIENLYMSGAISGFIDDEMRSKIDNIIEFADIGEFIYQPLKTYSSGMKARLGFAFAINIEPEILIIDEALSVGDVAFQRKCYAKIEDMCKSNEITVLFVSHSGGVIKQLCSRAIMLKEGQKVIDGNPSDIINLYEKFSSSKSVDIVTIQKEFNKLEKYRMDKVSNPVLSLPSFNPNLVSKSIVDYPQNGAKIDTIELLNINGERVNILEKGKFYFYKYQITFFDNFSNVRIAMQIKNKTGINVGGRSSSLKEKSIANVQKGETYSIAWKFKNILNEGEYLCNCGVNNREYGEKIVLHRVLDAYLFKVISSKDDDANGFVDFDYNLSIMRK